MVSQTRISKQTCTNVAHQKRDNSQLIAKSTSHPCFFALVVFETQTKRLCCLLWKNVVFYGKSIRQNQGEST